MSTFFSILTLVLGAGVMVFLFLKNCALSADNFALELENSELKESRKKDAWVAFHVSGELDLVNAELAVAKQERDRAWQVIEMLVSQDIDSSQLEESEIS